MRLIDADATIKYLREFRCKDCDRRKGMKNGKIRFCYEIGGVPCRACDIGDTIDYFLDDAISPTVDAVPVKEQQEERKRLLLWLSKFCRHIDNGDKWLTDEENLEFFREKMKQQFGWFAD